MKSIYIFNLLNHTAGNPHKNYITRSLLYLRYVYMYIPSTREVDCGAIDGAINTKGEPICNCTQPMPALHCTFQWWLITSSGLTASLTTNTLGVELSTTYTQLYFSYIIGIESFSRILYIVEFWTLQEIPQQNMSVNNYRPLNISYAVIPVLSFPPQLQKMNGVLTFQNVWNATCGRARSKFCHRPEK